jgi:hypothetical protein
MKRVITLVSSLVIAALVIGAAAWFFYFRPGASLKPAGDFSEYSAVALTSNELFFGRITKQNETEIVLEDVYFFTFVQDGQNGQSTSTTTPANNSQNGQNNQNLRPTLIDTAANDSIAPTRVYVLNRDQVKYTYPLKSDSTVVKTIDEYKNK